MTPVVINLNIERAEIMQAILCSEKTGIYEVFVKPF